jgi:competence protein ComEC
VLFAIHPYLSSCKKKIRLNILVPAAISYISGSSVAGFLLPGSIQLRSLTGLTILLLVVLFFFRRHRDILLFLLPAFILIGYVHTGHALLLPDNPDHLYNLVTDRSRVTLTGTVLRMPEFNGETTRFEMEADSILFHRQQAGVSRQIPAKGRIRLSMEGPISGTLLPGDHLMVLASANRTFTYQTPGVFDYRLYLAGRSVYVTGRIASPAEIIPYTDLSEPWYQKIRFLPERARYRVGSFLKTRLDPQTAGLYQALLIGTRSGVSSEILENFKATGCMHLLAISGIHMGLLGMMIAVALTWIMKRSTFLLNRFHVPTIAALLSLLPLIGYAFIAGLNMPVLRALVMSVFFIIAIVLRRQRSIVHVIAAAALLLLIFKPLALFTVSFQLSFSSVLAIGVIYPRLLQFLEQKPSGRGGRAVVYILAALFVSIAATLGSLPFMLYYFNRFSPVGPLMNLLVEPLLCLWSLPIGLVALPLVFLSPDLAGLLLQIGAYGISAAVKITSLGSTLPLASLWTITPTFLEITAYYGILLLWYFHAEFTRGKQAALLLSIIFVIVFSRGLWLGLPRTTTEVTFLDIGQGTSTLVRPAGGKTVLLDGGNTSSSSDPGERIIAPFLWKKQIWRLDDIIITHPHSDHYNGLGFILRRFKPARLWINAAGKMSMEYKKLLQEAEKKGVQVRTPAGNSFILSEGDVQLTALNITKPETIRQKTSRDISVNDQSLVLRLQHENAAFLFPGDISEKREKILVDTGAGLKADVLLAPHHGSRGSGSPPFISAVNPEIIVISAGRNRQGRYLDPDHLKRWRDEGRTVLATSLNGTITITTDGRTMQVTTFPDGASGSVSLDLRPKAGG